MSQGKAVIIVFVTLLVGFAGGFVLRPVIITPTEQVVGVANPSRIAAAPSEARGTQYFAANLDEARRIVGGCRDGSVRGDECVNAERAVTEAEGRDRFKKFMGH
jgi:hypothetical protein